jgi:hypothetical protein
VNLIYPNLKLHSLSFILAVSAMGAGVAGIYGVLHDQITYTLSPEYFSRLKFHQFAHANFGLHPRFFVAEIGFLATWWMGLLSGWFVARVIESAWSKGHRGRQVRIAFSIILLSAILSGATGWGLAYGGAYDREYWTVACQLLRVEDVPAFVKVAYIHYGSYSGGLLGLIAAIVHLKRKARAFSRL